MTRRNQGAGAARSGIEVQGGEPPPLRGRKRHLAPKITQLVLGTLTKRWISMATLAAGLSALRVLAAGAEAGGAPTVVMVVGAEGESEYGTQFQQWARQWEQACDKGGVTLVKIGAEPFDTTAPDIEKLKGALAAQPREATAELWLVLLGHGTFDGRTPRFNLRGGDISAGELKALLEPFHRPLAVINASACSGPFIKELSAPGRVIVTATRSGEEDDFAHFGKFLSELIASPSCDLDKDGQTSLLEAFLAAANRVAEFYKAENRIATEHALIDDNGDGFGTPGDWFIGLRTERKPANGASVDGRRAGQFVLVRSGREQNLPIAFRARRDQLELEISKLRDSKSQMPEGEYYKKLEVLMLDLARLYRDLRKE